MKKDFKTWIKILSEGGYWGQGSDTSGAASFHGTYFGFGGEKQLAKEPDPSVRKIKKQTDAEALQNIEDQMKVNSGYPIPQSSTGFSGGESKSGIRSGTRIPNNLSRIAFSVKELENLERDETKDFWDLHGDEIDKKPVIDENGYGGNQRGVASDQNYRDLPGYPRHNSVVKNVNFVPVDENDIDANGEEDVYLGVEEYVNDVLFLNGLGNTPENIQKTINKEQKYTLKNLYKEFYTSPSYGPEPNKGIERYKQGKLVQDHEPGADKKILKQVDFLDLEPAEVSPGGQAYGQIGQPKKHVPDDWEQRNEQVEESVDFATLENVVKTIIENKQEAQGNNWKKIPGKFQKSKTKKMKNRKKYER
jgi:hypothetical protein